MKLGFTYVFEGEPNVIFDFMEEMVGDDGNTFSMDCISKFFNCVKNPDSVMGDFCEDGKELAKVQIKPGLVLYTKFGFED